MAKKHHMSKREYNKQKKHRRHIKRRRDTEHEISENRVSHGRLRERNQMHAAQHIRNISDLEDDFFGPEDDFFDAAVEEDDMRA